MVLASSCIAQPRIVKGNGKVAKGAFDIALDYTELSVSNGIIVELVPYEGEAKNGRGEGFITADDKVLGYVSIIERDGKVKVSYEPQISVRLGDIKTVVTMPISSALARLDASSAAKIVGKTRLMCGNLDVDCSSAAKVDIGLEAASLWVDLSSAAEFEGDLSVRDFNAELSSAAKCKVAGTADSCNIETSSAASVKGYGFVCRSVSIDASSAGSVEITATEELNADVSSGASVRYKGNPTRVRQDVSSGGSLKTVD